MTLLLQTRPGTVVRMDDPALHCRVSFFRVETPQLLFDEQRSIVTRMALAEQTNLQFLQTLSRQIFVYNFGDQVGELTLSGLSFPCDCTGEVNGAERMLNYYRRNRASRRRMPCRVLLGNTPIEGLMVRYSNDVVDASLNLMQWNLTLKTFPAEDDPEPLTAPTGTVVVPVDYGGSQGSIPPPIREIPPPDIVGFEDEIVLGPDGPLTAGPGTTATLPAVATIPLPDVAGFDTTVILTSDSNPFGVFGDSAQGPPGSLDALTPFEQFQLDFPGATQLDFDYIEMLTQFQTDLGDPDADVAAPQNGNQPTLTDLINDVSDSIDQLTATGWDRFRELFGAVSTFLVPLP
jgi:hypothetical protein